jgi:hypothetical protein
VVHRYANIISRAVDEPSESAWFLEESGERERSSYKQTGGHAMKCNSRDFELN